MAKARVTAAMRLEAAQGYHLGISAAAVRQNHGDSHLLRFGKPVSRLAPVSLV